MTDDLQNNGYEASNKTVITNNMSQKTMEWYFQSAQGKKQ